MRYYLKMNSTSKNPKDGKERMSQSEVESYVTRAHQRASGSDMGDVRINILVRRNNCLSMELLNRFLAPYGVSNVGYFAMMMVYSTSDNLANPSEICRATGETRGNMTRICDELVDKGLMQRVTNPDDRRRVDLSLTDKGAALLNTVVPALRDHIKELFAPFSEAEKNDLVQLLLKFNQALMSHI